MTKTELQLALAEATQTSKKTAGVFLETLSSLAYKEIKKNGEFVLPGFGKLVKRKRKARCAVFSAWVGSSQRVNRGLSLVEDCTNVGGSLSAEPG